MSVCITRSDAFSAIKAITLFALPQRQRHTVPAGRLDQIVAQFSPFGDRGGGGQDSRGQRSQKKLDEEH